MNTSAAARDLSTDAASLRIDREPRTRLRGSHYRPVRWVGPVLLLSGSSARLFDLRQPGVSIGLWVQGLAVLVATVAGAIAIIQSYVGNKSLRVRSE